MTGGEGARAVTVEVRARKKRCFPRSVFSGSRLHVVSSALYFAVVAIPAIAYTVSAEGRSLTEGPGVFLLFVLERVAALVLYYCLSYGMTDWILRKTGARTLSSRYRKWRLWAWSGRGRALFFHLLSIIVNAVLTVGMAWVGWRMYVWLKGLTEFGEGVFPGISALLAAALNVLLHTVPFLALLMAYHTAVCLILWIILRCIGGRAIAGTARRAGGEK